MLCYAMVCYAMRLLNWKNQRLCFFNPTTTKKQLLLHTVVKFLNDACMFGCVCERVCVCLYFSELYVLAVYNTVSFPHTHAFALLLKPPLPYGCLQNCYIHFRSAVCYFFCVLHSVSDRAIRQPTPIYTYKLLGCSVECEQWTQQNCFNLNKNKLRSVAKMTETEFSFQTGLRRPIHIIHSS